MRTGGSRSSPPLVASRGGAGRRRHPSPRRSPHPASPSRRRRPLESSAPAPPPMSIRSRNRAASPEPPPVHLARFRRWGGGGSHPWLLRVSDGDALHDLDRGAGTVGVVGPRDVAQFGTVEDVICEARRCVAGLARGGDANLAERAGVVALPLDGLEKE